MAAALNTEGFSVVSIEYRRIPGDPDASLDDVTAALVHPWAVPGKSTVGIGHSAGGHLLLAAIALHTTRLARVIGLAPVADFALARRLSLDHDAAETFAGARTDIDPCTLPVRATPVDIVHGDGDEKVPIKLSENYVKRHGTLHRIRNGTHFSLIDPQSRDWPSVMAVITHSAVAAHNHAELG